MAHTGRRILGNRSLRAAEARSRAALDLTLSLVAFAICSVFVPYLNPRLRAAHGFGFVLATALYQFCAEGLIPLSLLAIRREAFATYGFTRKKLRASLRLGIILAIVYDIALSLYTHAALWIPLRRQPAIRMSLAAGLPFNLLGIAITVATWGFLEGFFGIYFARKVNVIAEHSGRGWFAPGPLAFAVFNGAVHLIVGQGFEGFITSLASGYAIAVVPALVGNSWGGTLVQTLTNAVGSASH